MSVCVWSEREYECVCGERERESVCVWSVREYERGCVERERV